MAKDPTMGAEPEQSQSSVSPPVESSERQGPADSQSLNESDTVTRKGRMMQQEAQVFNSARDHASGMPQRDPPAASRDVHLAQQVSTTSSPFSMLNLDAESPSGSELVEMSVSSETRDIRDNGSATTGLQRAYSTILESANIPIGHQSSRSLRHVVMSRTTSQAESLAENRGNNNSSPESFVQIFSFEPDQPDIENPMQGQSFSW